MGWRWICTVETLCFSNSALLTAGRATQCACACAHVCVCACVCVCVCVCVPVCSAWPTRPLLLPGCVFLVARTICFDNASLRIECLSGGFVCCPRRHRRHDRDIFRCTRPRLPFLTRPRRRLVAKTRTGRRPLAAWLPMASVAGLAPALTRAYIPAAW